MAIKIIKLTQDQKKCVEFKPEGELLIRGIPGAGKTTVLLERALYLRNMERSSSTKIVLFLTYTKALSTYLRQLARTSDDTGIEALTFHSWGTQILKDIGKLNSRSIEKREQENLVAFAKRTIAKYENPTFPSMKGKSPRSEEYYLLKFLREEISWIKCNEMNERKKYLDCVRVGRGNQIQVTKTHRKSIFDVYEKYQEMLASKNYHDHDDIALLLLKHSDLIPKEMKPLHILLDEAQDLTPTQFKVIKKLAAKSLTIAADKGQQIYRRSFTWKSVDIDIKGTRNRFLNRTFRSTKQIIQLAKSLQAHDKLLLKDEDFTPAIDPETPGLIPEMYMSTSLDDEFRQIIRRVKMIVAQNPNDTIGVIANSQERLDELEMELIKAGIVAVHAKSSNADFVTPGVKLVSYHSSKGLEFDHVIVTGLMEDKIPSKLSDRGDDQEAFIATERRRFYVAMTRARLTLTLSAVTPISPFVRELDSKLYKLI